MNVQPNFQAVSRTVVDDKYDGVTIKLTTVEAEHVRSFLGSTVYSIAPFSTTGGYHPGNAAAASLLARLDVVIDKSAPPNPLMSFGHLYYSRRAG